MYNYSNIYLYGMCRWHGNSYVSLYAIGCFCVIYNLPSVYAIIICLYFMFMWYFMRADVYMPCLCHVYITILFNSAKLLSNFSCSYITTRSHKLSLHSYCNHVCKQNQKFLSCVEHTFQSHNGRNSHIKYSGCRPQQFNRS